MTGGNPLGQSEIAICQTQGLKMTKKIVTAGDRVYLKFFDLDFFHKRAKEADAVLSPFKEFDEDKFKTAIADADALIVIDRPLTEEHITAMQKCKIILALEVGYDFIDVKAASENGIIVSNVPAYAKEQVAVHALTLMLSVYRKIKILSEETSRGGWNYNVGKPQFDTRGKKLGIIGLGKIGRTLVQKVQGLGLEILSYDPYIADDIFKMLKVKRCYELDELLDTADFISLHVPLTDETYHMIGEKELMLMKKEAVIINTCRGKVIDEKDLYQALKNDIIAGAGLDVLEKEPPDKDNPILTLSNALVTPHAAWYTEESLERLKNQGMDEVIRVLKGERPRNVVNPEVLYK
jgi:D-3-phosphoglycerate dehydrogenase